MLTAVRSSDRRREVRAGTWTERDGDPPSRPCAVTLCVLVVEVCLQNTHPDTYKLNFTALIKYDES